jgi:hypothetical protein
VPSQMDPSHSARIVAVREAPLDQFASLAKQGFPIRAVHSSPVLIDRLPLLGLALPMPLALLLLLWKVRSYVRALHRYQHRTAVVTLVSHHFLDTLQMHLRILIRCFRPNQLGDVFARLYQSL